MHVIVFLSTDKTRADMVDEPIQTLSFWAFGFLTAEYLEMILDGLLPFFLETLETKESIYWIYYSWL